MGWTDVGSWGALWDIAARDGDGNTLIGDVIATDSRNSYVRGDGRLIAVVGVEDLIVVDTADALLVAPRAKAQDRKSVVQGKGVSVRVDLGGRRRLKKKTDNTNILNTMYQESHHQQV